eukprot:scaffold6494_cov72-Skeletonema_dohrnii-CCMP3373.AAC.2
MAARLRCLIRSPTTLQRRRYDQKELEPCKRCFYTIMANYHGSSEAADCHIHSVRYDMVRETVELLTGERDLSSACKFVA